MMLAAARPALTSDGSPEHAPSARTAPTEASTDRPSLQETAARLFDAEVNLHRARQSGLDAWIAAAYEHLHLAVQAYAEACR